MNCPNCEARVADGAQFCPNCGCDFTPAADTARSGEKKKKSFPKLSVKAKIILITVAAILLLWLIFFIVVTISGNKGMRTAEKLAGGIGSSVFDVVKGIDYAFLTYENVSPEFLNEIEEYDRLCKSDNDVRISGVSVPEWVIYCLLDDKDRISSVKYYNFKTIEKNWKGAETDSAVNTDTLENGMTIGEVSDLLGFEPLSIEYSDNKTIYEYRYYCLDIDKNERSYFLTAEFNESGRLSDAHSRENKFITFFLKDSEDEKQLSNGT